jgi:hypothetical protein
VTASGVPINLAHCSYCGKEFDVRRFQVRRMGSRELYDSTECASLAEVAEPGSMKPRRRGATEAPLKLS